MLSSKHIASVMLTFSVAGAVLSGLLLAAPAPQPILTTTPPTQTVETPVGYTDVRDRLPQPTVTVKQQEDSTEKREPEREQPPTPKPHVKATAPTHARGEVALPDVGFKAPIGKTTTVNGVVTPPDFKHIFRVTDLEASVYVTHSCRFEQCLGNSLFHLPSGKVFVEKGQTLWVDGKEYVVTETRTVPKKKLPADPVWATDGVAIITCYQNKDLTPSTHNLVVIAQPADSEQ